MNEHSVYGLISTKVEDKLKREFRIGDRFESLLNTSFRFEKPDKLKEFERIIFNPFREINSK